MKEKMWEDMFTPEGVPMTSPYEVGMTGRSNGWQDMPEETHTCKPEHAATVPVSKEQVVVIIEILAAPPATKGEHHTRSLTRISIDSIM